MRLPTMMEFLLICVFVVLVFVVGLIIEEKMKVNIYFCRKFPDAILYYCGDTAVSCSNSSSISCNTYAIRDQMTTEDMLEMLSLC